VQRSLRLDKKHNSNTPPAVPTLAIADVETGPKLAKHRGRKALGEDVGELRRRRDVKDPDVSNGNPLADEVEINLDMLRTLMLNQIGGEIHSTYIVTIDKCGPFERTVKFQK